MRKKLKNFLYSPTTLVETNRTMQQRPGLLTGFDKITKYSSRRIGASGHSNNRSMVYNQDVASTRLNWTKL